jgi:hypothetical protein
MIETGLVEPAHLCQDRNFCKVFFVNIIQKNTKAENNTFATPESTLLIPPKPSVAPEFRP